VVVTQGTRRIADELVRSGTSFRFLLSPGIYRVTSSCARGEIDKWEPYPPKIVTVSTNRVSRVNLECLVNPAIG